jgi:hypothetical protein
VRIHLVPVSELHRPDLIAASELGDAELSWLLADANPVARPSELCQEVGQAVRIPLSAGMDIGQSHGQ